MVAGMLANFHYAKTSDGSVDLHLSLWSVFSMRLALGITLHNYSVDSRILSNGVQGRLEMKKGGPKVDNTKATKSLIDNLFCLFHCLTSS